MKKERLLKSLLVVLAMSLFSVVAFAQATAVGTYKKVTAAPANGDWSGQYLIVCESDGQTPDEGPFIFDGSGGGGATGFVASYIRAMCNVDIANGTIEITQAAVDKLLADNLSISSTMNCGDMHFTINKDGQLFSAQGYYFGAPGSSGAPTRLKEDKVPETGLEVHFNHTITLKSDGTIAMSAQREGKTRYYLRMYFKASTTSMPHTRKFGYYSSSSYKSIHLYKLVENEGGEGGGGDVVVAPEKPTASVESGDYLEAFSVTLACATDGATIKYKLNGGEEQTYSEAINISATTTLVAWAEKDTLKSEKVTFTYNLPAEVANIAALIADQSGKDVRITSTISVIARSGQNLWVKDASACMLVKGQVGGKSSTYNAGDQFTGLIGKITTTSGVQQITPKNFPATTATGVAVEPEVVAPEAVTADVVHKYIRIEGATYTSKTLLTVGETSFTLMDYFLCLNNNKEVVVGDKVNISVIVALSSGKLQLYPVVIEKVEKPEVKATWSVEEGATIESLGNISVTFDGVEKAATTQTVPVCFYAVDENNVETPVTGLAIAGAISASSTNATITFDASSYRNLAEGKYRIRLAVGDVYFNGDKANVSTEEYVLTFNYVLPVEPTFTVSPENHSIVKNFKEIVITYPELEMIGVKPFVGEPDLTWPFFNQTLVNENGEVTAEQALVPMVWEQVAANAVKISLSANYGFASVTTAGTYSVTIPAGLIIFPTNKSNRAFTLYYTVDPNLTDVDNATLSAIFVQDGRIVAEGEYQIYTITGQNVTGMNGSLAEGVYVVKAGNSTVKVIVK